MTELGPDVRPTDLLPGDPDTLEQLAGKLARLARTAGQAHSEVDAIDSEHWSGAAGEAFRAMAAPVPLHLGRARDALESAAHALRVHALTLRDGQAAAAQALRLAADADSATSAWQARGATGADPGAELRDRAQRVLHAAREDVDAAARATARRLQVATADAPGPTADIGPAVGGAPTVHAGRFTAHGVVEHPLLDRDNYAAHSGATTLSVDYRSTHDVGFAGSDPAVASWAGWQRSGNGVGEAGVALVAALGIGAGAAIAARRRRTAMRRAGVDPAELTGGYRARTRGVVARLGRSGGVPVAYRTHLAHPSAAGARTTAPPGRLPATPGTEAAATSARPGAGEPVVVAAESMTRHTGPPPPAGR